MGGKVLSRLFEFRLHGVEEFVEATLVLDQFGARGDVLELSAQEGDGARAFAERRALVFKLGALSRVRRGDVVNLCALVLVERVFATAFDLLPELDHAFFTLRLERFFVLFRACDAFDELHHAIERRSSLIIREVVSELCRLRRTLVVVLGHLFEFIQRYFEFIARFLGAFARLVRRRRLRRERTLHRRYFSLHCEHLPHRAAHGDLPAEFLRGC